MNVQVRCQNVAAGISRRDIQAQRLQLRSSGAARVLRYGKAVFEIVLLRSPETMN